VLVLDINPTKTPKQKKLTLMKERNIFISGTGLYQTGNWKRFVVRIIVTVIIVTTVFSKDFLF
jgi:hypothetical protein